ncbi:MAG: hypothetical protein HWE23_16275 [Rhodobacteraceae bacterium]|nr:hypothetical protein [Paracoccaceae bacterium]
MSRELDRGFPDPKRVAEDQAPYTSVMVGKLAADLFVGRVEADDQLWTFIHAVQGDWAVRPDNTDEIDHSPGR